MIRLPTTNTNDGVAQPNEQASTEVSQTVTFHNDEEIVVKEYPKYVSIGSKLDSSSATVREQGIKDFLGRPLLCASGVWSTTAAAGVQLQTLDLPQCCLNHATFADKVRGFLGFRAKIVCRVTVNSQRFQQGRLLLHYLPQANRMGAERRQCALSSLMLITQQPRVDFNLNEDTEVRLEIPYVSTELYYNLQERSLDIGTLYLTVYSPLVTGAGSTTCGYSIFCHFEDVELVHPCHAQTGIKTRRGRGGASTGAVDSSGQELQSEGLGPISSLLAKGSKAMAILSEIPLISSFTAPTSWAMSIMSRAADSLGYCKPTSAGPVDRRAVFAYMNNVNAADNSTKVALLADNHVGELPGFAGTDIDEMSLTYVLGIPAFWISNSWTTSHGVGTALCFAELGPTEFSRSFTTVAGSTTYSYNLHPPMGYVANIFAYYRGSVTITIKVTKTEFHSGRLLISFFPGRNLTLATTTFDKTQGVYRDILDLRTSSEATITFPWTSLLPYLPVTDSYGAMVIHVLNPLVAPENLSTSCTINYEVSAAPDMEFAVPVSAREQPIIFSPQSGLAKATSAAVGSNGIGMVANHGSISTDLEPALYCVGERVQSIRQLVKRFTTAWAATAALADGVSLQVMPQVNYVPTVKVSSGMFNTPEYRSDMLSYFSVCYRYQRGGTRVKVFDPNGLEKHMYVSVATSLLPRGLVTTGDAAVKACCDQPIISLNRLTGGGEYEMPQYSCTPSTHVRYFSGGIYMSPRVTTDNNQFLQVTQGTPFSVATRIYRAAADDLDLGFFFGTVPTSPHSSFMGAV